MTLSPTSLSAEIQQEWGCSVNATIASFFLIHKKGLASGQCLCYTKAGDLTIEAGEKVMMQMAKPHIVATVEDTEEIYRALGIKQTTPNFKLQTSQCRLSPPASPTS
ncbi:MAG: hypothetical protein II817_11395 [Bacteroidales bacterium]|nr:hypothetical protein [Bacteroidales bacterium]